MERLISDTRRGTHDDEEASSRLQQAFASLHIQRSVDASGASFGLMAPSHDAGSTWVTSSESNEFDLEHGAGSRFVAASKDWQETSNSFNGTCADRKCPEMMGLQSPIAGGSSRWGHDGKRMRVSSTPQSIKFDKVTPPPKYRSPTSDTKSFLIDMHRNVGATDMSPIKVIKELFEPRSGMKSGRMILLACATGILLVQAAVYVSAMHGDQGQSSTVQRALTAIKVKYYPGVKPERNERDFPAEGVDADFYGSMLASLEKMDRTQSEHLIQSLDAVSKAEIRSDANRNLQEENTASGASMSNQAHQGELPVLNANSELSPVFLSGDNKWELRWKGEKMP